MKGQANGVRTVFDGCSFEASLWRKQLLDVGSVQIPGCEGENPS